MPITLVVEDGTGLANANTYNTLEMASTYFDEQGITAWAEADDDEARKGALVRAAKSLDTKYQGEWPGQRAKSVQRRAWPRAVEVDGTEALEHPDGGTIPVNSVPVAIREAHLEVALIELGARFLPQVITSDNAVVREKVDVIETEYRKDAPMTPQYPHIDQMLRGYIDGAGDGVSDMVMRVSLTEREARHMQGGCDEDYLNDPRYFVQG